MSGEVLDILKNIITNFSLERFELFFKRKTSSFRPAWERLSEHEDEDFTDGIKLGEIKFKDDILWVCAFKVKQLTERSSKKKQYEKAKKVLKYRHVDAGIFIFYDGDGNFRFSLVYANYLETKREFSYYKRYTYFVSSSLTNKTFLEQVGGEGDFSSLEGIKKAFSVEPVTKQFYKEIQNWYFWAMDKVEFPRDYEHSQDPEKKKEIRIAVNLIRLITRLMFVWFLKEKGLVPEDLFDKEKLKNIVKDFDESNNYYNAIFQNLFFATLNQKMTERKFAKDGDFSENRNEYGVKTLFRYKDRFLISEEEVLKLFKDIPFLNGGLFECLDKEDETGTVIYIDGFSRDPKKQAKIPDYLFFKEKEERVDLSKYGLGKKEPVRGLIEILKSYNFTVDEATPIDQEIALDPELLGKVFENLLASYNPETSETARKSTGSYYTPREIVDYMVDESLKEYFKTTLSEISSEKIELLLSYSDEVPEFSQEEKKGIVYAIDRLKIIDPACGSGAFLMGILHKLVHILQKIDPENKYWHEPQYEKAVKQAEEAFDESINYPDYERKLYLIESCIYGVDIQPIATQLSKLRFFISLLIDQKVDKSKENFGIRPLPNLETNIVCANTLVGLKKSNDISYTNEIEKLEEEIKRVRHKYFTAKTREEKLRLQREDRELRKKLKEKLKVIGFPNESSEKIANFDPYDQNASTDWFDPEWMFGITDGFDIVIGNPPYVSTKGVTEKDKKVLKQQFGFVDDIYNHFYLKGIQLLKEKGILTYISSKTFWTIQTKKNLRQLILKNKLLQLVDTANPFQSAVVDTCIAIVQKDTSTNYEISFIDISSEWDKKREYKVKDTVFKNVVNNVFFKPNDLNMKIYEQIGKKLKPLMEKWWDKISTSKNIEKYKTELEKYRQSLKPGDITLLGLITEGGVGIQTGNNGKYIGVLEGTKWAKKVREERSQKLWKFIQSNNPKELTQLKSKAEVQHFLKNLSEQEIRILFDDLKEKYGRDIFGQGWLYRIVSTEEIADVEGLTEEEKLNGIEGKRTFVPYDKGDKEGNRWWAPTPYYIDWSRENVKFLKENSGKKGEGMPVVRNPQFYFREGFCWNNVTGERIICRVKEKSVHSTEAMTFISVIPEIVSDKYLVCLMNSTFFGTYKNTFLNVTVHLTTGDAKEFPIIIPTQEQLKEFESIFNQAVAVQKEKFAKQISEKEAEEKLTEIQRKLDEKVMELYGLKE